MAKKAAKAVAQRLKSKTNQAALLIGIIGLLETNLGMLKDVLGEYYGLTYIAISIAMMVLREVTTQPVSEK